MATEILQLPGDEAFQQASGLLLDLVGLVAELPLDNVAQHLLGIDVGLGFELGLLAVQGRVAAEIVPDNRESR